MVDLDLYASSLNAGYTNNLLPELDLSAFNNIESHSYKWGNREAWVRKELFKLTKPELNISNTYKETLRTMISSFNDVGYINAEDKFKNILCIHANAERAIAKLKQDNNIILPILSIAQTISDNDLKRRRYDSLIVSEKWWDNDKNRAFRVVSLAPRAVTIKYALHIWTKYNADMDQILEQVRLKFNPCMEVPTSQGTITKAYIESEEDVGEMTAGDKEDRVLKKTITIHVQTYIPNPKFLITSTGRLEKVKIQANQI
jgi:hypothetical protein